uniref:Uncharacterized protein n=1 Tax=Plectus sambesii TaxID=2011161 RepID=A0A914UQI3_9BILA
MDRGPLSGLCERLGIHHGTFAVCITSFGSNLAHTVFMFYYVKVFLSYHISEGWFQFAQVLFLLWNALNDPLFGYFQDMGDSWMRNRKKCILLGAPFFALSFLLPWFPWTDTQSPSWITGVHMIVALFFYDGFFSFVLLAWSALFAENTTDHGGRVRAVKYSQIAALIAVNVIVVMEKLSNSLQDMASFQVGTVVIAMIAFCCWSYTGMFASSRVAQVQSFKHVTEIDNRRDLSRLDFV